jgi:hypothetical protein
MARRLMLCLCLLALALAAPVGAAAPKKRIAHPAAAAKPKPVAPARTAAKKDSTATARAVAGPRRLEDIHIEGEIPAPQVLFVTARDQRRFTRFHHHRYLKTSARIGETTTLPSRVALTSPRTTPAGAP